MFSGSGILLGSFAQPCSERQVDCNNDLRAEVHFVEVFSPPCGALSSETETAQWEPYNCTRGVYASGTFWVYSIVFFSL